VLANILAGDPGAKLYAMPLVGDKSVPTVGNELVPITVDQFYHGTDEEVLSAVMSRTKKILYDQKSLREKAGEAVDLIQSTLDAISLIPVVGDVAAGASGLIDLGKGNLGGAAISFASLIPIAGEAGAAAKVTAKFAKKLEELAKVAKIAKIGEVSADILKAVRNGTKFDTFVYRAVEAGKVVYVGITSRWARRAAAHLREKGIKIVPLLKGLSRSDARAVEQVLIEIYELGKDGGTLLNKINSIAKRNKEYGAALRRGLELLESIGYKPGM